MQLRYFILPFLACLVMAADNDDGDASTTLSIQGDTTIQRPVGSSVVPTDVDFDVSTTVSPTQTSLKTDIDATPSPSSSRSRNSTRSHRSRSTRFYYPYATPNYNFPTPSVAHHHPQPTPTDVAESQPFALNSLSILGISIGSVAFLVLLLTLIRCCASWRRTPSRDRIAAMLNRFNLQREMEERDWEEHGRRLLGSRFFVPPPPYVPPPPVYKDGRPKSDGSVEDMLV